ncbi:MAG: hypothetical protein N2517_05780 [Ignavibacteria bacterium]|nr:hypothetical protein [Ignavibacteria bacterium]
MSLLLLSCVAKVSPRYNIKPLKDEQKVDTISKQTTTIVIDQKEPPKMIQPPVMLDTIEIDISYPAYSDFVIQEYSRAKELFANKDYQNALLLFRSILGKIDKEDNELYIDVKFKIAECLLHLNKLEDAGKHFLHLLVEVKSTDDIKEKVLVRLVLISCLQKDRENHKRFFQMLSEEFPNSKFLNQLQCE